MKTDLKDWTTLLYSGVLLLSGILCILLLSSFKSHAETTSYVAIQGGSANWMQKSNSDELEAGAEVYGQYGIALGKRFTFDRIHMRVEIEGTYRHHEIHGRNGSECWNPHYARVSNIPKPPLIKCQADASLRVGTLMLNYWPGVTLIPKRLNLYAGGGVGGILFSGLNQQTAAWGAQAGAGLELRLFDYKKTRWILDAGYRGLWALETRQVNGNELEYTSMGPVLRLGVEW